MFDALQAALGTEVVAVGGEIERSLLTTCRPVIDECEVQVDDKLFKIGTSSLKLAQIHEWLEQRFPKRLEVTDVFDYPTVTELAAFPEKRSA